VRINPDDIHLNDPFFYDTLYAGKRKKDKNHVTLSGVQHAMNVTLDFDLHRQRRGYVASLFFKEMTLRMEPLLQLKIDKLTASCPCPCTNQQFSRVLPAK
jgi:hypothetical protein